MVGTLIFPIFLIGLTSAQCPTPCNDCKVFNVGEMCGPPGNQFDCEGVWNLQSPNPNPRCTTMIKGGKVNVCLYKREVDNKEYCFCDPGDSTYEACPPFPDWWLCKNPDERPCVLLNETTVQGYCNPQGICYPDCNNYDESPCKLNGKGVGDADWHCCPPMSLVYPELCVPKNVDCWIQ